MLTIKNVKRLDGTMGTVEIESSEESTLDAKNKLLLLPALIDPHVHFRIPGSAYKEDWMTASRAAVTGGVTTVFDMPNNNPPVVDKSTLQNKTNIIDGHLKHADIPLRYHLWLGADKEHLDCIKELKDHVIGIKIYMGSTTGGLLMDDPKAIEEVFKIAAENNMIVAVHAEDEPLLRENKKKYEGNTDPSVHSKIRDRQAAILAVTYAISLSEKYGTKLYVAHVSTKEEIELIRKAKERKVPVFAEVTPHHLHLTVEDYSTQGNFIQVNPPIRTQDDVNALWEAIIDGTVDTIGSDHAPHTIEEKKRPYGEAPSGVPGVELTLPLLLTAHHQGKISLEKIVALTSGNIRKLFNLPPNDDCVLIDCEWEREIKSNMIKSKCGWSPYTGRRCRGWPRFTVLKGKLYEP